MFHKCIISLCTLFYWMPQSHCIMMKSWNGNIFRITGPLCGEFIGHRWIPLTSASDAQLWCIIWSAPERAFSTHSGRQWFQTASRSIWRHCSTDEAFRSAGAVCGNSSPKVSQGMPHGLPIRVKYGVLFVRYGGEQSFSILSAGHQWLSSQGTSIARALIYLLHICPDTLLNKQWNCRWISMDGWLYDGAGGLGYLFWVHVKQILGLDVMGNFILQIWKYLINMYTFTCILLTIMFLWAHAKMTMFWGITLPQNIGEICQVCNKKCSLSVTLYNVKTV